MVSLVNPLFELEKITNHPSDVDSPISFFAGLGRLGPGRRRRRGERRGQEPDGPGERRRRPRQRQVFGRKQIQASAGRRGDAHQVLRRGRAFVYLTSVYTISHKYRARLNSVYLGWLSRVSHPTSSTSPSCSSPSSSISSSSSSLVRQALNRLY